MTEITCDQVRVLVSQRCGLHWLSEPVAIFVTHFPRVECDLFPGDMTLNAIRAATEFLKHAPAASLDMLAADYSWLAKEFADDDLGLWSRAAKELEIARTMARAQ